MERETLTLTLHGMPAFNSDVDGEVFARKFFKFMQGLGEADQAANGSRRLKYLIEKLEKNTATASVREQVSIGETEHYSGIKFYSQAVDNIYHYRQAAKTLPVELVKYVLELPKGLGESFERGEIKGVNDNFIPIDANLERNARRVLNDIQRLSLGRIAPFAGKAHISLDGTVISLDARGEGNKAVVVLTAGGKQVDCIVSRVPEEKLRAIWKKRCVIRGYGHYSGNQALPDYIDAVDIQHTAPGGDWANWRGALNAAPDELDDWH